MGTLLTSPHAVLHRSVRGLYRSSTGYPSLYNTCIVVNLLLYVIYLWATPYEHILCNLLDNFIRHWTFICIQINYEMFHIPENLMSLSSPMITSSISWHWPSFTVSGLSNVETISPPVKWEFVTATDNKAWKFSIKFWQKGRHKICILYKWTTWPTSKILSTLIASVLLIAEEHVWQVILTS